MPGTFDLIPPSVPVLRGDGVVLRELTEADLAPWFARLSDREAATLAGDPVATSMDAVVEGLAYHRVALRDKRSIRWAIVPQRATLSVGTIGLNSFEQAERTAEIGAAVGRAHWSQGIATRAGRCVVDYARSTLRLRRIDAIVLERNTRVARVLDKLGFVCRGEVAPERRIGGVDNVSLLYSLELEGS